MTPEAYTEFLRGKRVVLVAPGRYLTGLGRGSEIDSYDVVVRLNLDCPVRPDVFRKLYPDKTPSAPEDIGTRTDVLYHTLFNDALAEAAGQQHTPEQIAAWAADGVQFLVTRQHEDAARVRNLRAVMEQGDVQIPAVHPPSAWYRLLSARVDTPPNIGTLAIAHLLEQPIASLHVMGMKWTEPWEGYRVGYGGFDEERAAMGTGVGHWGKTPEQQMPHAQAPQLKFLLNLHRTDPRFSFDRECSETAGLYAYPTVDALVLIKQHSERLPGKNTRIAAGRPLFHWILKALHEAARVERVYVDTDSEEIAAMVREHHPRTEIILNTPRSHADRVIESDLGHIAGEHILQTHPTSPLVRPETVDAAVEAYFSNLGQHDSLYGVTRHQTWFLDAQGQPVNADPAGGQRTQDLAPLFEVNSSLFIFSRESFATTRSRMGRAPQMFTVPKHEAVDIDHEEDFQVAEALLLMRERDVVEAVTRQNARYSMSAVIYSTTRKPDNAYVIRGAVSGHKVEAEVRFETAPTIAMCQQALLDHVARTPEPGARPQEVADAAAPVGDAEATNEPAGAEALLTGSVATVKARIDGVTDVTLLSASLEAERAGAGRKTALAALQSRLDALTAEAVA